MKKNKVPRLLREGKFRTPSIMDIYKKIKPHNSWEKKYKNRREGKLFDLLYELKGHKYRLDSHNEKSYLSAALWAATKGTKMENDAKDIIKLTYPEFFQDE